MATAQSWESSACPPHPAAHWACAVFRVPPREQVGQESSFPILWGTISENNLKQPYFAQENQILGAAKIPVPFPSSSPFVVVVLKINALFSIGFYPD